MNKIGQVLSANFVDDSSSSGDQQLVQFSSAAVGKQKNTIQLCSNNLLVHELILAKQIIAISKPQQGNRSNNSSSNSLLVLHKTGRLQEIEIASKQEIDAIRSSSAKLAQVQRGIRSALQSIDQIQKQHLIQEEELKKWNNRIVNMNCAIQLFKNIKNNQQQKQQHLQQLQQQIVSNIEPLVYNYNQSKTCIKCNVTNNSQYSLSSNCWYIVITISKQEIVRDAKGIQRKSQVFSFPIAKLNQGVKWEEVIQIKLASYAAMIVTMKLVYKDDTNNGMFLKKCAKLHFLQFLK